MPTPVAAIASSYSACVFACIRTTRKSSGEQPVKSAKPAGWSNLINFVAANVSSRHILLLYSIGAD